VIDFIIVLSLIENHSAPNRSWSRHHSLTAIERKVSGKSVALIFAVICLLACAPLHAQEMIVGVNVVNPMRASVADQNTERHFYAEASPRKPLSASIEIAKVAPLHADTLRTRRAIGIPPHLLLTAFRRPH
jgi:hypothetical protein